MLYIPPLGQDFGMVSWSGGSLQIHTVRSKTWDRGLISVSSRLEVATLVHFHAVLFYAIPISTTFYFSYCLFCVGGWTSWPTRPAISYIPRRMWQDLNLRPSRKDFSFLGGSNPVQEFGDSFEYPILGICSAELSYTSC